MDVTNFSKNTKQEADGLLTYGNVLDVLSKYGKVVLSGSFEHDLMWGPDIDLVVVSDKPEEVSYCALKDFIEQRKFQKYQLGDFAKFPLKNRPHDIIVVLIHEYNGRRWEIEIWFLPDITLYREQLHTYKSKINEENRLKILYTKHERNALGQTKYERSSIEIYDEILNV